MGAAHGQEKAQDLGGLPTLPREHPCRAAHRSYPDVITGEQGAWKPASPVREGADGKGPRGGTSPVAYFTRRRGAGRPIVRNGDTAPRSDPASGPSARPPRKSWP